MDLNATVIVKSRLNFGELTMVTILSLLTVVTIVGNLLVMCAIFVIEKLRQNVTNCFIASLAAADLLLGTIVMPFSVIEFHNYAEMSYLSEEERKHYIAWPYGQDWCDVWHAFDVLSSTASILNLCVISVERYIAISDPFNYQTRMTHSRALIMTAIAWICSSLISFPAIAWWRTSNAYVNFLVHSNSTVSAQPNECTFPLDQLYLFLSSCVSFHIPLIVMVFVYWRIYRTATRVMQSLSTGSKVIDGSSGGERLVLRVHRGGSKQSTSSNSQTVTPSLLLHSVYENGQPDCSNQSPCESEVFFPMVPISHSQIDENEEPFESRSNDNKVADNRRVRFAKTTQVLHHQSTKNRCCYPCACCGYCGYTFTSRCFASNRSDRSPSDSNALEESASNRSDKKKRSFNLKRRLNRFSQEQRAAKTLGVIMGAFICCWLPFFVYNTIKSINPALIKEHDYIVFPLVTWLGYINSSINPFIYALSLRDIRRAFRQTLCNLCSFRKHDIKRPWFCFTIITSTER